MGRPFRPQPAFKPARRGWEPRAAWEAAPPLTPEREAQQEKRAVAYFDFLLVLLIAFAYYGNHVLADRQVEGRRRSSLLPLAVESPHRKQRAATGVAFAAARLGVEEQIPVARRLIRGDYKVDLFDPYESGRQSSEGDLEFRPARTSSTVDVGFRIALKVEVNGLVYIYKFLAKGRKQRLRGCGKRNRRGRPSSEEVVRIHDDGLASPRRVLRRD